MLTCPDIEDLSENIHVIFITPKSPLVLQIEFVMNQKKNERELPTKPNGEEQNIQPFISTAQKVFMPD